MENRYESKYEQERRSEHEKNPYYINPDDSPVDDEEEEVSADGEESEPSHKEKHKGGLKLLTSIQIFGSLAILAAALILRVCGTSLYQTVRTWYLAAVNDSILAEEQTTQAKHTIVGLWNNFTAARLQSPQDGASSASSSSDKNSSSRKQASSTAAASSGGKTTA